MSYILQQSAFLTAILHSLKFPQYAVIGLLLGQSGSQQNAADDSNKGSAEAGSNGPVIVEDALPLFHTSAVLLPMLELALVQADALATQRGQQVVGVYAANERVDDVDLSPAVIRIADTVAKHCPQACCLLLNAESLPQHLRGEQQQQQASKGSGSSTQQHRQQQRAKGRGGVEEEIEEVDGDSSAVTSLAAPDTFKVFARDPLSSSRVWRGHSSSSPSPPLLLRPVSAPSLLPSLLSDGKHYLLADFQDHLEDAHRDWHNLSLFQ